MDFHDNIKEFIEHIESLANTQPLVMFTIENTSKNAKAKLDEFLDKNCDFDELEGDIKSYKIEAKNQATFTKLKKRFENVELSKKILPKSFVITLISVYDAYLGNLIRTMFYSKPEILNSSQKILTFADLMKYSNFDEAKAQIIEAEVEAVLRESHNKHFVWLENKLGTLRKDLEIWPVFIELTERRNLFVHCNGVISDQYLTVCKEHGVTFDKDLKIGNELSASQRYYRNSFNCIFEIGIKLGYVMWRKLKPEELEHSDGTLNSICMDLIAEKRNELAITLLKFANKLPKYSSDNYKYYFKINLAQAYKWKGEPNKCKEIISSVDWSTFGYNFKFAVAVLEDNYKDAAIIMKKIGAEGDIGRVDYQLWPLFKEFRKTAEFRDSYMEIFGEEYHMEQTQFEEENI